MTDGIAISDLTVTYRNGHTALRDANLTVPAGSITALVGVNGAGKSTLFKALMGFIPSARGRIIAATSPTWVRVIVSSSARCRTSPAVMSTQRRPPQPGHQQGPSAWWATASVRRSARMTRG